MLSIQHVCKNFGRLEVLRDVQLELKAGRCYALIGPNGSGKTTLIKCVLGMIHPSTGTIEINYKNILNTWQYRAQIGYMPQIGRYPDTLTIGQLFDMMKNIRNEVSETDEELIDLFDLVKIKDKPMRTLSGGTRQKVSAALAFLFQAPIIILDEPTAGLDPVSAELFKEKIVKEIGKGKLILITSHVLSDLDELATDLIYLWEGRVQYKNEVNHLKQETGENRLSKAVSAMLRQRQLIKPDNH
jgi:Cu-processing system ATP-binding protein